MYVGWGWKDRLVYGNFEEESRGERDVSEGKVGKFIGEMILKRVF